jgi:ubiquinone/menaquinone biosynthesis C-methylase UbiE
MEGSSTEAQFWDRVAAGDAALTEDALRVLPDDLHDKAKDWLPYLGVPTFVNAMFDHIGEIRGRRVLDLGAGTGFLACALALRGAQVDALDVSPASIDVCRRRAALSGVSGSITFSVAPAEDLPYADGSFDAVAGLFVLHHTQLAAAATEIGRVLRPGGRAAFLETIGLNPLLMAARRHLTGRAGIERASSEDEAPLDKAALEILRAAFPGTVALDAPTVVFMRMGCYLPFMQNRLGQMVLAGGDRLLGGFGARASYYGRVTMTRHA